VQEAVRLGKRIIPVLPRSLDGTTPPQQLADLNYILFYDEPKSPGSGFGSGQVRLVAALNTDLDWLREHTRLLQRASEWNAGGKPINRLLSGTDIDAAKAWVARRPKDAPEPTSLHLDFIRASEDEAKARLNFQRQQLEAISAAQAERGEALNQAQVGLEKATTAQRWRRVFGVGLLTVVSIAAVVAVLLWQRADGQRKQAEVATTRAVALLGSATNLIVSAQSNFDEKGWNEARLIFEKGAELGSQLSMFNLGIIYDKGRGVAQDYAEARKWYEKAAATGDAKAMVNVGNLYKDGHGVDIDFVKAREWYFKAAGQLRGSDQLKREDDKAVSAGDAIAMRIIGQFFERGEGGLLDYVSAREWYERAAIAGDPVSMRNIGMFYQGHKGVQQDYVKAREWYEKAAAAKGVPQEYDKARGGDGGAVGTGDAFAMRQIGRLFEHGLGVEPDPAKAREWYEKAFEAGDEKAMTDLIDQSAKGQRFDEAMRYQEKLTAKIEAAEIKLAGKAEDRTATALTDLGWRALFARDYAKSLAFCDRSLLLRPGELVAEGNRAHALMFLDHRDEARAIYITHKGQSIPNLDKKIWEAAIAEDFEEFRKAGLTHPMMTEIEKALGISTRAD
jgi:TPR repeat protein